MVNRAVMEQRNTPPDALDYFPTPPWAVRAFCTQVLDVRGKTIWEPACGEGHMAEVFKEYGAVYRASDIFPYGYGEVDDFLADKDSLWPPRKNYRPQFVITNPPFNKVLEFIERGLEVATEGVWVYCRLPLLETIERYERLYQTKKLREMWVYVERVPVSKGWCDPEGGSATAVAWFRFGHPCHGHKPTINFIVPCRKELERPEDYTLHWLGPRPGAPPPKDTLGWHGNPPVACTRSKPCCARAGEYNGFGSDGPLAFHCDIPNGCSCHD